MKTADIDSGAITPEQLNLGLHSATATEGSTTSTTPVGLPSLGPIVTVDVPTDALVVVYAVADIRKNAGTTCFVHIAEAGLPPSGTAQLLSSTSSSYVTKFTAPGTAGAGTSEFGEGGWVVFPASAGSHTYNMRYSAEGPSA